MVELVFYFFAFPLLELWIKKRHIRRTQKIIRLRMNPEHKKDGRKKMRLLVRGDTEPLQWNDGKCLDSPTVMASSIKMLLALHDEPDTETEVSIGDISTAFLTSPNYGSADMKRYVAIREFKGAPLRVFQLLGSAGCRHS